MKVCVISSQLSNYGKIGGFGSMTRQLAEALHGRGVEVSVVVPKILNTPAFVDEAGIRVFGIPRSDFFNKSVFRKIDADLYHSQNPNLLSWLAQVAQPQKKHVITCRDPRDFRDWMIEFRHATLSRKFKNILAYLFEGGYFVKRAVGRADRVGVPAHFLKAKVRRMYGREGIAFFPNVEKFPTNVPRKSAEPSVCYIGRLDKRKKPEVLLSVARALPNVTFHVIGKAEDPRYQEYLDREMAKLENVSYHGYLSKHQDLERFESRFNASWMLLNTAAREGLPMTFIEAAGRGCAIVSRVNPDDFASRFGYQAKDSDDLIRGIRYLMAGERWKALGEKAREYVLGIYSEKNATDFYLRLYQELLQA